VAKCRRGGRRRRRAPISDEDAEFLKAEFGSISKGIETLVKLYRRSLGPSSATLNLIFNALISTAETNEGELSWEGVVETVCKTLGCDKEQAYKHIQDLFAHGYLTHSKQSGYLRVLPKRSTVAFRL